MSVDLQCCMIELPEMNRYLHNIFSRHHKKRILNSNLKPAAVLIPLFYKKSELHILFIKRSNSVVYHKGQISFPGGQIQKTDANLQDTALRESWEEIGLSPQDAEIIGELDDTRTRTTRFLISPFIASIPYPYKFKINPQEISGIMEVPVTSLMDRSSYKRRRVIDEGESILTFTYDYNGEIIWGATARILKQLLELLKNQT